MDVFGEVIRYFPLKEQAQMRACLNFRPTEIRVRTGRRKRILWIGGEKEFGENVTGNELMDLVSRMVSHSIYAWEDEMGQGYFTLPLGVRVGVTGRFAQEMGKTRIMSITSLLIRIAHEARGAAESIRKLILEEGAVRSTVILAPPGMGKTTLLRDICRMLSNAGKNVSIVDERGEIAAVRNAQPQLDVGERADVCEGLSKSEAIMMLMRSMSPDVICADEIGSPQDADALYEAARMGVGIVASVHAGSIEEALSRPMIGKILASGTFANACVLNGLPGRVTKKYVFSEGEWRLNS